MYTFDDRLKLLGKIVSAIGWCISIYFSAQGFGLDSGPAYVAAGYFLACLVTLFEVFLGRFGAKMPRALVALCLLAMGYGVVTNIVGILAGRGGTGLVDYAIAISLGIVLEVFPERLYMFVAGIQSADLVDAVKSLSSTRPQRQPDRPRPYQEPPVYQPKNRSRHPGNPRHQRNSQS